MDDGLGSFLVVLFFIIVSMMDAAARKRRKVAQGLGHLPTSDDLPEGAEDLGRLFESSEEMEAESGEGAVPDDLWGEIAALARGETPTQRPRDATTRAQRSTGASASIRTRASEEDGWTTVGREMARASRPDILGGPRAPESLDAYEAPDESLTTGTQPADLQAGYAHPDQALTHREHAQVVSPARPLSETLPHDASLHSSTAMGGREKEVTRAEQPRGLLAGVRQGARQSLREAIVLAEVFSPPVVMRNSEGLPFER